MKKITIINTLLIFLVIFGTVFANLNAIVSIMPRDTLERDVNGVDNSTPIVDFDELDVETMIEVADYIQTQATINNFEISTLVYSSGLLFESDNSLIIIGHGYFNSTGQYFIADYSANRILQMTENKEVVALLACYSNNIELENDLQLIYTDRIDLTTAIQDMINLLSWTESYKLNPIKNIQLHALDPGGSGNGWSLSNPPSLFNNVRQAYTYAGKHIYWNLLTDLGERSLYTYMMSHKWQKIEFTYKGDFLEKASSSQSSYYLTEHLVTFDAWIITKSDTNDYVHFGNVYRDNNFQKKAKGDILLDQFLKIVADAAPNLIDIRFQYTALLVAIAAIIIPMGVIFIKFALEASGLIVVLAAIAGPWALAIGVVLLIAAFIIGTIAIIEASSY